MMPLTRLSGCPEPRSFVPLRIAIATDQIFGADIGMSSDFR